MSVPLCREVLHQGVWRHVAVDESVLYITIDKGNYFAHSHGFYGLAICLLIEFSTAIGRISTARTIITIETFARIWIRSTPFLQRWSATVVGYRHGIHLRGFSSCKDPVVFEPFGRRPSLLLAKAKRVPQVVHKPVPV
jgi:hypothetical protein